MNLNFVKHIDINSDSESMIAARMKTFHLTNLSILFTFRNFRSRRGIIRKETELKKATFWRCVEYVWWLVKQMFWKERFRDNFDEITDINVTWWQAGQATGDTVHRIVVQEPFYCRLRQSTAEDLSLWRGHCSNLWETLMIVVLSILVIVAVFK